MCDFGRTVTPINEVTLDDTISKGIIMGRDCWKGDLTEPELDFYRVSYLVSLGFDWKDKYHVKQLFSYLICFGP